MNKKTVILIISAVVVAVLAAVMVIGSLFGVKSTEQGEEQKLEEVKNEAEEKIYTPTFVYFISNEHIEATQEVLDKLKNEYDGKIIFDIRNIDETGEDLSQSFGNESMPLLLMHDKKGDMCSILMQNSDYEDLKGAIEAAIAD